MLPADFNFFEWAEIRQKMVDDLALMSISPKADWKALGDVMKKNALGSQVGGNHYKNFAIQPVEFIAKNDLPFLSGCVLKRLCRFDQPGGKGLQDLLKAKHEIDLIIELGGWDSI